MVNSRTNSVDRIVAIGGVPPTTGRAIAADAGGAWVLSSEDGLGVLTRAGRGIESSRDYRFDYGPRAVAVGAGAVWVAARNAAGEFVLRISPATGDVLATVPLSGSGVQSIVVGEGAVWVLRPDRTIFRVDPATNGITGRAALPVSLVSQIAAGAAGLWATVRLRLGVNALVRIDPRTLPVSKTIAVPQGSNSPQRNLAVGQDAVWWNSRDAGLVWKVDPETAEILRTIRISPPLASVAQSEPLGITAGAGAVWVTVSFSP